MKIVFWGRKIKIQKVYIIIAAFILLIILTIWGWYLKANNIDVFVVVSDDGSNQPNQSSLIKNTPDGEKSQTQSAINELTDGQNQKTGSDLAITYEPDTMEKVNINTADIDTLIILKGIGVVKANAVIDYRRQNGPFKSIEEIMNVKGIKEATFAKIKDNITVD